VLHVVYVFTNGMVTVHERMVGADIVSVFSNGMVTVTVHDVFTNNQK
jgi:predicted ABC-type sugar transport system permease subunit